MHLKSCKTKSKQLKTEIVALYLASKRPRTPWYAKALAAFIIGYALSPIDLIPDFIPVVGYLDDFIIIPAGIALLIKIIPGDVLEECRAKAQLDRRHHHRLDLAIGHLPGFQPHPAAHLPFFRRSLILRSSTVSMSLKGWRVWMVSPSCSRTFMVFSKTLPVLQGIFSKTLGEKVLSLKPIR